jgi:hypothetical protein
MAILAWVLAILGFVVGYIVTLGGAMTFGIPFAIAILSLPQVFGTYLSQPGGPR